jgi:hypothetical protein
MKNLLLLISLVFCSLVAFAESQPCQGAEHHQLDFWLGQWELSWPDANGGPAGHGTNNIQRALDGCVIEENFSGEGSVHLRGRSFSVFDTAGGMWKQTWVDNEGGYLDLVGGLKDGKMSFWRESKRADGSIVLQRMVWTNVTADAFDWTWESSKDGGKSWQVQWPVHYQRKQAPKK